MKWFAWLGGALLALIVVAVLVLLALGQREGSDRLVTSVTLKRPPAVAFEWIADGNKMKQWVSWLSEVKYVSGGPGLGETHVHVMNDPHASEPVLIEATTTAYDPPHRVTAAIKSQGFHGTVDYVFTELPGGGTRLDYEMRFELDNAIGKLMLPIVLPQAREKAEMDFKKLEQLVAAEPQPVLGNAAP